MIFTIEDIRARLEELKRVQKDEDDEPASSVEISLADEMSENMERTAEGDAAVHGFILANIPIDEWNAIPVSPLSLFGESIWDFSCYPALNKARVNFDYVNHHRFNLVKSSRHWIFILKALLFYKLPKYSFSGKNRAYGDAVLSNNSRILYLIEFFRNFDLYQDCSHGGAPARIADELSRETVLSYLSALPSAGKRWTFASILQYWQNLSRSGMLPPIYCISSVFVSDEEVSKFRREMDESSVPFEPIPLDDYANIVAYAASMVNDFSSDLLWLARTYYPTLIGRTPDRAPEVADGLSLAEPAGVAAFRAYQPTLIRGEPWWSLRVLERSHPKDRGEYISYAQVSAYVQGLLDCCITIIFATTGMRRSEVAMLSVDCTETDKAGHWLIFKVYKTSVASQGDTKKIPIPEVTFNAVEILRKLCDQSRKFGCHNYLLSCINRAFFGKNPHWIFADRALGRVAESCGIAVSIHPHRFRKSLAMYIIYQDTRNIEIIRHLFSHKSLRMTLRYIVSLPGVNEELKRYIVEKNTEILAEVMSAAESGRIGGRGGCRVRENLTDSKTFHARLQDKGKETLEQYVDSLLDAGIKLLHRTNLAICIRSPNVDDVVPCVGKDESAAERLHPNLFACDPFNCNFAVFTESHVEGLVNEIQFHERMLTHPYCGKEQVDHSMRRISEAGRRLAEVTGSSQPVDDICRYG